MNMVILGMVYGIAPTLHGIFTSMAIDGAALGCQPDLPTLVNIATDNSLVR